VRVVLYPFLLEKHQNLVEMDVSLIAVRPGVLGFPPMKVVIHPIPPYYCVPSVAISFSLLHGLKDADSISSFYVVFLFCSSQVTVFENMESFRASLSQSVEDRDAASSDSIELIPDSPPVRTYQPQPMTSIASLLTV
jgi:hypothetical protein